MRVRLPACPSTRQAASENIGQATPSQQVLISKQLDMVQFDSDPVQPDQLAIVPFVPRGTASTATPAAPAPLAIVPFVPPGSGGDTGWAPLPALDDLAEFMDEDDTQRSEPAPPTPSPRLQRQPPAVTPSPSPWAFWGRSSGQVGEGRAQASDGDEDLLAEARGAKPLDAKSVKQGVRCTKPKAATRPGRSLGGQPPPDLAVKVRCALKPTGVFCRPANKGTHKNNRLILCRYPAFIRTEGRQRAHGTQGAHGIGCTAHEPEAESGDQGAENDQEVCIQPELPQGLRRSHTIGREPGRCEGPMG